MVAILRGTFIKILFNQTEEDETNKCMKDAKVK
jgi:hypothetical protein